MHHIEDPRCEKAHFSRSFAMNCPQFCLPCCCYCCPCAQKWSHTYKKSAKKISFVEYGQVGSHSPESEPESPADREESPDFDQVLQELSAITQEPTRARDYVPKARGRMRRISQPILPRTNPRTGGVLVHSQSQPGSPFISRARRSPTSPQPLSPLYGPSPRGSPLADRRRSVQMASLHQDFYSDSNSSTDSEEVEVLPPTDVFPSDYETSITSEGEELEESDQFSGASLPLLPKRLSQPRDSTSSIPQIIVTEPFEIGTDPLLQFSLYYDFKRTTLIVHLQKAFNLSPRDPETNTCNPFVIVYLLPNREADCKTYETRVVHNTLNPSFDEMFQYPQLNQWVARQQTLVCRIYHHCGTKQNIVIGGVLQPLENADFHGKTIRKKIAEDFEEFQVRSFI